MKSIKSREEKWLSLGHRELWDNVNKSYIRYIIIYFWKHDYWDFG